MARHIDTLGGGDFLVGNPSAIDITGNNLTLAAWINPVTLHAFGMYIAKWNSGNTAVQYMLRSESGGGGTLGFWAGDGGSNFSINATKGFLSTGVWQHVAGTLNGSTVKAFINGSPGSAGSVGTTMGSGGAPLRFGRASDTAANQSNNWMAEVGIWNVGLTDDEVAALAKGFSPLMIRPQNLRGYWPIFGNASPEPDLKNGNNGALSGTLTKQSHPRIIVPRPAIYVP